MTTRRHTHPADAVLPSDREAERALIGCLLIRPAELLRIGPIDPDQLTDPDNATVLAAIMAAWERDPRCDLVAIVRELRGRKALDRIGGPAALDALMANVVSPAAATGHTRRIIEMDRLRRIMAAAQEIIIDGAAHEGDVGEFIASAEARLLGAGRQTDDPRPTRVFDVGHELYQRLEQGTSARGVLTGFNAIDRKIRGLKPGNLCIVAARPSMGKSALALNIAEHAAREQAVPTLFISLEMTRAELTTRMLAGRTGIHAARINEGELGPPDYVAISDAIGDLRGVPLHILDAPALTMAALKSQVRRLVARESVGLVIVDYLQLIRGDGRDRYDIYSRISNDLKALAAQAEIPIIACAQLNRESERRPGKRPQLGDLRESGAIEQDADVVLLIHREDYHHKDDEDYIFTNRAEVIVAKNRNGPTGVADLAFDGKFTRFANI